MMKNWPLTVLTAWISVRLSFVRIHLKTNPNAPSPNFTPIRKCFLCIFFLGIVGGISISLDAEVGVWEDGLDSGRDINSVLCWILSFLIKEENVWSYGQSSKAGKFSFKQEKWVTFTIFMTSSSPDSEVGIWEDAPDSGRRITSILCCVVLFLIKEDDLWSYAWTKFENWKIDSISIYN